MTSGPELAWVLPLLPGAGPEERLEAARAHGLALEVRSDVDVDAVRRSGLPVATVQAWDLHRDHPLQPGPGALERARAHGLAALRVAERLGAPRVLTVLGFAERPVADESAALERCLAFLASLERPARERGVRVLVEPLSRRRTAALAGPAPVRALLERLPRDVFGAALDTGHLLDHGLDPAAVLADWPGVEELQLRGRDGALPGPELPLETWLETWLRARPTPPAVLVAEHRDPAPPDQLAALVRRLRAALARLGSGRDPDTGAAERGSPPGGGA